MNAPLHIDATAGIQFREHPTQIDCWTVDVDGKPAGTIERDGGQFIARAGRPYFVRTFNQALDTIAEVFRHQKACEAQDAEIAAMSSADAAVAMLERRKALLPYSASHMDVGAREAEIDRRIALVRGL